ncbi:MULTISPECIES: LPS-assembly lipoprotein LptE [Janthinobacterium]|uniref:LPS-assembly lipoprotein LptE n=1 Tax=Janthinobacterium kumbetense TaxID=2950280 RepID=A0ABT0WWJ2_9BURK|nr:MULTISPECIES: LPS assembly lipoprotein LptE [Janthinobacterium]MCM2568403.1 LPS assembly lipoprotein LptE [Janthinobacterium kumbetense]MDN2679816.1 LPS assembly lipoprotein LptE [Janthinobacterium sp. SUN033]MDO8073559.1 LPS assembly lipoprotein LptE [Janthinobacterium sp. SUN176]MED5615314.1 LPS assembly lipoprotein LptE [Janthinobacterium sp. P210005]PIF11099.1 LPS-assembly lipoprotein [Janthinobacterium sp. 13]
MTTSSSVSLLGRRAVLALGLTVLLSACGFHLRGSNGSFMLPFATMYIGLPDTSPLAIGLKRYIRAIGSTEVVNTRDGADAVLEVLSDPERNQTKTILSLNKNGRVQEYQLGYSINFRVVDKAGNQLLAPTTISLVRPITFDDSQVLAKETEEAALYRDMRNDLVQQIMRRLAAIKPVLPAMSVAPVAPVTPVAPAAPQQ